MFAILEKPLFVPKKHRAWFVVFSAALFFFYEFVQINMFNAISHGITHTFNLTATQLGNLAAMYLYSTVICLFPIGLLLDRYSTRKLIIGAMSVCILCTILFATAPTLRLAMFFRLIAGGSGAFCFLSALMLASRWFPNKQLGLVIGLIVTVAMLGGIAAQAPLTFLADHFTWRVALFGNVFLGILFLWIIICLVEDYPENFDVRWQHKNYELGLWQSIKGGIINIQNWVCAWYTCLLNLLVLVLGAVWGSNYLVAVHHLSRQDASYVTTMIFVGNVIGCPLIGWISDKLQKRKQPMIFFTALSILLMLILNVCGTLSFSQLLVLFLLLGFTTSAQVLSYPIVAESNPRPLVGASEGVVSAVVMSGGAIFQPLFGYLMDMHWSGSMQAGVRFYTAADYQFALWLLPIAFSIALVLAALTRRKV